MTDKKKRKPANKSNVKANTSRKNNTQQNGSKMQRVKSRVLSTLWSFFWKGTIAAIFLVAIYIIYLDAKISRQFEGNKWELPVQVYARSMQFFPDQFLNEDEVLWELKRLNYSRVNRISVPVNISFKPHNHHHRRAFEFYDGPEVARIFTLNFAGKKLANIVDNQGRA